MYAADPGVRIETYPDLWRKGRYRVELHGELPCGPDDVDAALRRAGYRLADADQWGYSYVHRRNAGHTAEVDEHGQPYVAALILRNAGLEQEAIDDERDALQGIYERIHRLCFGPDRGHDDRDCPLYHDDHLVAAFGDDSYSERPYSIPAGDKHN